MSLVANIVDGKVVNSTSSSSTQKAEKSNAAKICLNFCEDMRNKGFPAKLQHKPPIGVKDLYRGFVQFGLFNLLNAYFTVCKTVK